MARLQLDNVDFNKNQSLNRVIQQLASAPGSPVEGQEYWNTVSHVPFYYTGAAWQNPFDRQYHTNTQLAATISDFDTQVRTSRLDQMAAPTADVTFNNHKLTNLTDATNPQDAVNLRTMQLYAQGFTSKGSAAATTTAVLSPANSYANGASGAGATLTATGVGILTVDGYNTKLNDYVLVKNEATGANNGFYLVTTEGTAGVAYVLTRAVDMDISSKFSGAFIVTDETSTTLGGAIYLCNQVAPTVGTTAITFTNINPVVSYSGDETSIHKSGTTFSILTTWAGQTALVTLGTVTTGTWNATAIAILYGGTGGTTAATARANLGATTKYSTLVGDGAATSIDVVHNLGTRDVVVLIYDAAGFGVVDTTIVITTTNKITVSFAVAPASNAYRVVVVG